MKRFLFSGALSACLLVAASPDVSFAAPASPPATPVPAYAPHRVIVKLKLSLPATDAALVRGGVSARVTARLGGIGAEVWDVGSVPVADAVKRLSSDPRVEFAEPDYIVHVHDVFPNDPLFGQQWSLYNSGQPAGRADSDIDAPEAWTATPGATVLVAVVDTGVDLDHEDLESTIYVNPGEIPGNGIDDDGNGMVDDVHGWDFVNDDNDPDDDYGHGTHVSGLIAAPGNNGVGMAGVCWSARILPLKFLNQSGSGSVSGAVLAIQYAVRMGAKVINCSWGGIVYSSALRAAMADAGAHDILCVASTGNDGLDTDYYPVFPAGHDLDNIIAVAGTDRNDALAAFSNYGRATADLAAPGYDIVSTFPGNHYVRLTGTSMSCAIVSGAACLLWSRAPFMTGVDVKATILASVDPVPVLADRTVAGGRLNLQRMMSAVDTAPPAPVVNLAVQATASSALGLTWTATGDDGSNGTASRYEMRYSTSPINVNNIGAATLAANVPHPKARGSAESFEVGGLFFSRTYYFALTVLDEAGNRSTLSNIASGVTRGVPHLDYSPDTFSATSFTGGKQTRTLSIHNDGPGTLDFSTVVAPAWVRLDPASGRVGSGETKPVQVIFDALHMAGGRYDSSVILVTNDPEQTNVVLAVGLEVSDAPDIGVSTTRLDMGTAFAGSCAHKTVTVTNRGTRTLLVSAVDQIESPFVAIASGVILGSGESFDIPVHFCPTSRAKSAGAFRIQTNDPDQSVTIISLLGKGVDPPAASASPSALSVNLYTGGAAGRTVSLSNSGGSNLDYVVTVEAPDAVSAQDEPTGAASHDVVGVARPLSRDAIAEMRASSIPTKISVDAAGRIDADSRPTSQKAGAPSPSPQSGNHLAEVFGSTETGFFGAELMRGNIFKCTQTTDLKEYRFYLNPVQSTDLWFVVYEGGAQVGLYGLVGVSNLSPSPSGPGWYSSGNINVHMESNRYYLMVATWVGTTGYFLQHVTSTYPIPASFGTLIAGAGYSWGPFTTFPPFGYQGVESDAYGPAVAYYQTVVTRGVIPWLSTAPETGTVGRGGTAGVDLHFDASEVAPGDYDADVRIASNDPDQPVVVVPVHLHVESSPDIALLSGPIGVGECFIGTSAADTLWLKNNGTDILDVSHLSSTNSSFVVSPPSFFLGPHELAQLMVTFTPKTTGVQTGLLTITSNDPDESSLSIQLSGTGRRPPHVTVPSSYSATSVEPGAKKTSVVPIVNSGESALSFELVVERAPPAGSTGGRKILPTLPTEERRGPGAGNASAASPPRGPSYSSRGTGGRSRIVVTEPRAAPAQHGLRVLILRTGDVVEIASYFFEDPDIEVMNTFDGEHGTPTLADLSAYDVVLVINDFVFADAVAVGDVLADYVDHGGAVIMTLASFITGYDVRGRFAEEGYFPFEIGTGPSGTALLGNYDADHPIMSGAVSAFGDLLGVTTLAAGAEWVADWDNGLPFIATQKGGLVVAMNVFLADGGYWDGSVPLILRNAMHWAPGVHWLRAQPQRGVVAPHQTVNATLTFDAKELPVGNYSALLRVLHNDPLSQPLQIPVALTVAPATVSGAGATPLPKHYALAPNRPNPFNPATTIAYDLPRAGESRLVIYDVSGAQVRQLVDKHEPAGRYAVTWDGRDDSGAPVASGVYFYRFTSGTFAQTRKMVLLK